MGCRTRTWLGLRHLSGLMTAVPGSMLPGSSPSPCPVGSRVEGRQHGYLAAGAARWLAPVALAACPSEKPVRKLLGVPVVRRHLYASGTSGRSCHRSLGASVGTGGRDSGK